MANRFHPGRIAAAVLGASIALMSAAPLAFADNGNDNGDHGGYATPRGPRDQAPAAKSDAAFETNGLNVKLVADSVETEQTLLIPVTVNGQKVFTYCVELNVNIHGDVKMVEVPWDKYPYEATPGDKDGGFKAHAGKINWILQNSYPNVSAAKLTQTLTAAGIKLHNGLSASEAISATQSAIWNMSDGAKLDEGNPTPFDGKDAGADVVAAYHYLLDHATDLPQPNPAMDLTPTSATGKAGDLIGPFKFTATDLKDKVTVTPHLPNGVMLTDKAGNALGDIKDGTEIFIKVPAGAAADKGTFALDAKVHLNAGRLFVGSNARDGKPSDKAITQSLIVAKPTDITLHKEAVATWTVGDTTPPSSTTTTTKPTTTTTTTTPCVPSTSASPTTTTTTKGGDTTTSTPMPPSCATPTPTTTADTNELAYTGASVIGPVIAGIVLIGAGIGALFFVRRRKANHS